MSVENQDTRGSHQNLRLSPAQLQAVWQGGEWDDFPLRAGENICLWSTRTLDNGLTLYTGAVRVLDIQDDGHTGEVDGVAWAWQFQGRWVGRLWQTPFAWFAENGPPMQDVLREARQHLTAEPTAPSAAASAKADDTTQCIIGALDNAAQCGKSGCEKTQDALLYANSCLSAMTPRGVATTYSEHSAISLPILRRRAQMMPPAKKARPVLSLRCIPILVFNIARRENDEKESVAFRGTPFRRAGQSQAGWLNSSRLIYNDPSRNVYTDLPYYTDVPDPILLQSILVGGDWGVRIMYKTAKVPTPRSGTYASIAMIPSIVNGALVWKCTTRDTNGATTIDARFAPNNCQ